MIVITNYRGHRIEAYAVAADAVWNASVRIRRTFSNVRPHIETVVCHTATAALAEQGAITWAEQWIDQNCRLGPPALDRRTAIGAGQVL